MPLFDFHHKDSGEHESRQRMSLTEARLRAKRLKLGFEKAPEAKTGIDCDGCKEVSP